MSVSRCISALNRHNCGFFDFGILVDPSAMCGSSRSAVLYAEPAIRAILCVHRQNCAQCRWPTIQSEASTCRISRRSHSMSSQ
jgi:hypothetical protein